MQHVLGNDDGTGWTLSFGPTRTGVLYENFCSICLGRFAPWKSRKPLRAICTTSNAASAAINRVASQISCLGLSELSDPSHQLYDLGGALGFDNFQDMEARKSMKGAHLWFRTSIFRSIEVKGSLPCSPSPLRPDCSTGHRPDPWKDPTSRTPNSGLHSPQHPPTTLQETPNTI